MATDNVSLARRWFEEVWNQRRTEVIFELLTDASVCHCELGAMQGPHVFRDQVHAPFLAAFPDLRVEVDDTVAEGDQVVVRWSASGTHTGDGLGFPPTGRKVAFSGITWLRFENGKMAVGYESWNLPGLVDSLRPAAKHDDLAALQGTWVAVSYDRQGTPLSDDELPQVKMVVEGDRYRYEEPGGGFEGRFRLDPSKQPKEIDSIPTTSEFRGMVAPGIYELADDRLRIGFAPPGSENRPSTLQEIPSPEFRVYTLRKVHA